MSEMKSKLRKLRIIQLALIAVIPIFGWVAEIDRRRGSSDWTLQHWLVAGLTLWAVLGGFRIRHRLLRRSGEALKKDTSDPKALRQWEAGQVVGLAVAESVAVWGLLVRMVLGGALWQALSFYVVALFLLLLWTPRMPTAASSN
jgi:F0F1-type ATP synthase membrane subunit c/vacuolar-type H+-ATPase subunit K